MNTDNLKPWQAGLLGTALITFILACFCLLTAISSRAVDKLEQQAQGLIRDTRAYIGQASQVHMAECLHQSSPACETIVKSAGQLAQLERQLEQYCGWPPYTMQNVCKPHRAKKGKLKKLTGQVRKSQPALKKAAQQ